MEAGLSEVVQNQGRVGVSWCIATVSRDGGESDGGWEEDVVRETER